MKWVLVIGDKPSKLNKSNKAFDGARCEKRLMDWMEEVLNEEVPKFINRVDLDFKYTVDAFILFEYPIIALGNAASKALGTTPHFKLPHPSGLNRQINDKEFINKRLEEAKEYLRTFPHL